MNYFLDTEFTRFPWLPGSNLASLGIVREDGKEYFACLDDFEKDGFSDFFRQVNLPLLPAKEKRKSRTKIRQELLLYFDLQPTRIWSVFPNIAWLMEMGLSHSKATEGMELYSDYDYQLLKSVLGTQIHGHWPQRGSDLNPIIDELSKTRQLPVNKNPHDALADARMAHEIWKLAQ
jgi:hypothetical protein